MLWIFLISGPSIFYKGSNWRGWWSRRAPGGDPGWEGGTQQKRPQGRVWNKDCADDNNIDLHVLRWKPCKESGGKVKVKEVKSAESDDKEEKEVKGKTKTMEQGVTLEMIMMRFARK